MLRYQVLAQNRKCVKASIIQNTAIAHRFDIVLDKSPVFLELRAGIPGFNKLLSKLHLEHLVIVCVS